MKKPARTSVPAGFFTSARNAEGTAWTRDGFLRFPAGVYSMEPEIARSLVMVRVGETWDDFFSQQADFVPPGISEAVRESIWARYSRLGASTKCPQHGDPCPVPGAGDRAKTSPCLARLARRVEALQQIGTNFTPLGLEDARDLARHAEWQVHAQIAAFGEL